MTPQVSVVIPAYNAMKYLPDAVESVLRQTFTDFEVLIINDGSKDHIVQWASQLKDQRIRLISQENQGLSAARNTGISQAKGDYIAFLDADDFWEATKLEKQVHCFEENPEVGLVHTWMVFVDEQGKSTGRVMPSFAEGQVWKKLLEKNVIACPSVMARRQCFEKVGVFDCTLRSLEDWEMWIRIAACYPFAVIQEPLAYYRQVPGSMSKNCQVMEQSFKTVIEKTFQSATSDLKYLKNLSYGNAYLCLAWKALQSRDKDYQKAITYRTCAMKHYPQMRFSWEYIRLSFAITAMRWFGQDNYDKILEFAYSLRRRISNSAVENG